MAPTTSATAIWTGIRLGATIATSAAAPAPAAPKMAKKAKWCISTASKTTQIMIQAMSMHNSSIDLQKHRQRMPLGVGPLPSASK